jgi:uncharacterized membrane protein YjgN (DUF898 family)
MIGLTLGLAYPFAQASLERFKMRNTHYGDLQGHFVGSGIRLFFRGVLLWIVIVVPFLFGMSVALGAVDWSALAEAVRGGGDEMMGRIEAAGVGGAVSLAVLGLGWSVTAAALLYPVFQAVVLRWWLSGLRFGKLAVASRLRTGTVYAVYLRFTWIAMLTGVIFAVAFVLGLQLAPVLSDAVGGGKLTELLTTAIVVVCYVIMALAYSTIYQATVRLRLWKHSVDSLELSGLEVLHNVKAAGTAGSALGEGLADALNVGGI